MALAHAVRSHNDGPTPKPEREGVVGLDRVLWQRLDLTTQQSRVLGTRHRRPAAVSVSLEHGLRLRTAGLPTVVRA